MHHGCKTMSKEIGDDDVIDDVIKSKSMSTFWTSVTLLIFKLERWTNAQNVANWTGYLDVILISTSSQSLQLSSLCYEFSSFWKFRQVRNLRLFFHTFMVLGFTFRYRISSQYTFTNIIISSTLVMLSIVWRYKMYVCLCYDTPACVFVKFAS